MFRDRLLRDNARKLRTASTDVENRLWRALRSRSLQGVKFRRQYPVAAFIVDFCAPSIGLAIELDGGQHAEQRERDEERTRVLEEHGLRVLRFWNHEVLESFDAVLEVIARAIEDRSPSP